MTDAYRGLFGAFPYAFRRSGSWLFRSYVLVGGAVALLVGFLFALAVVVELGRTEQLGASFRTFARAFVLLVGLAIVVPTVAPVLLVARRHRRSEDRSPGTRYDAALAVGGYVFVASVYLGLVASMPECFVLDGEEVCRPPPSGATAPLVAALYAMPQLSSPLLPLSAAGLIALLHRRYR